MATVTNTANDPAAPTIRGPKLVLLSETFHRQLIQVSQGCLARNRLQEGDVRRVVCEHCVITLS